MSTAAVAVAVGLAVLLLLTPRRTGGSPAGPGPRRRPTWRRRPRRATTDLDLGVVATEVATRLRAGAPVDQAWRETLARTGVASSAGTPRATEHGVPLDLLELAARPVRTGRLRRRSAPGLGPATAGAIPSTVAACRLTHELGAPLADVLQRCADGLTEAGNAQAARAVALAGPRATARLLGWLPALGLVLGLAVGADPLTVLLDGGAGTVCLVLGIALAVAGRRWVASLERTARAAGSVGGADASVARGRRRGTEPDHS